MTAIILFIVFCLVFGNESTRKSIWNGFWKLIGFGVLLIILLSALAFGIFMPVTLSILACFLVGALTLSVMRAFRIGERIDESVNRAGRKILNSVIK